MAHDIYAFLPERLCSPCAIPSSSDSCVLILLVVKSFSMRLRITCVVGSNILLSWQLFYFTRRYCANYPSSMRMLGLICAAYLRTFFHRHPLHMPWLRLTTLCSRCVSGQGCPSRSFSASSQIRRIGPLFVCGCGIQ